MDDVAVKKKQKTRKDKPSFIDNVLDSWPVEMHFPNYSFLGPGTQLIDRLARGEAGINPLDRAALKHDLAYFNNVNRRGADDELMDLALTRVFAEDAEADEKVAAVLTACCILSKLSLEKFCHKVKKVFGQKKGKKKLAGKNAERKRKEKKRGGEKNKKL